MLERLLRDQLRVPITPLQNALIGCLRWKPSVLLPFVQKSHGATRTLLARVLSEVATSDLGDEVVALAQDALPEVRACAARALAEAPAPLALSALGLLAGDREWFVRLRAVAALGELRDARAIPTLVTLLCDRNRYVRLRAAMALSRLTAHLEFILAQVQQTRDRYAMQTLLSELQRSGVILELVEQLPHPDRRPAAEAVLLAVLRAGAHRLLLSALLHHRVGRIRTALARLLAKSGDVSLIAPMREAVAAAPSRRQRRISNWVLQRLQESPESRGSMLPVPA
jgi:HEAT repeat protein